MALFKIFSNMGDTSKSLPNTYNQGYCYFDVNTRKFWIDTAPDNATAEEKAAGRIAINAPYADIANFANVSSRVPFGTCSTADSGATKIVSSGSSNLAKELLKVTDSGNPSPGYPETGTMLMVYFEHGSSAVKDINLQIPYIGSSSTGAIIPVYDQNTRMLNHIWNDYSLELFVFMDDPARPPDNSSFVPTPGFPRWVIVSNDKSDTDYYIN